MSLNALIKWNKLLTTFGSQVTSEVLPTNVPCMLCCNGRMNLFRDSCQDGAWFHCPACGKRGDMITLTSTLLKIPESAAIAQLEANGAILPISNSSLKLALRKRNFQQPYENLLALAEFSTRGGRIVVDPVAAEEAARAGLSIETGLSWTADTVGDLVGFATAPQIEAGFLFKDTFDHGLTRKLSPSVCPDTVPHGLIFTYYGAGLCPVGARLLAPRYRFGWKHVRLNPRFMSADGQYLDGGFFTAKSNFQLPHGSEMLFTNSLELAVRMIAKHHRLEKAPLNLAAYETGAYETKDWQAFANTNCVILSNGKCAQSFGIAVRHGFRIANLRATDDLAELVKRKTPRQFVNRAISEALRWPDFLKRVESHTTQDQLVDWLQSAGMTKDELDKVSTYLSTPVQQRLNFVNDMQACVTVGNGRKTIRQRASGWYACSSNGDDLIIDAPFRVTQIVTEPNGEVLCKGEVEFGGRIVSFCSKMSQFDKHPLKVVRNAVIQAGVGIPVINEKYEKAMAAVIVKLSRPDVIAGVRKIGFQDDGTYNTPSAIYKRDCVVKAVAADTNLPLANYKRATKYVTRESAKTWQPIHYVAARQIVLSMLSGMVGQQPAGLLCCANAMPLVDALGKEISLPRVSKELVLHVADVCSPHAVPTVISQRTKLSSDFVSQLLANPSYIVLGVNTATAYAGALASNYLTLNVKEPISPPTDGRLLCGLFDFAAQLCVTSPHITLRELGSKLDEQITKFCGPSYAVAKATCLLTSETDTKEVVLVKLAKWITSSAIIRPTNLYLTSNEMPDLTLLDMSRLRQALEALGVPRFALPPELSLVDHCRTGHVALPSSLLA